MNPIEFYGYSHEHEIVLEFENGTQRVCRCRADISHNNIVEEVYDKDDNTMATCKEELVALGVKRATVKASHNVDLTQGYY